MRRPLLALLLAGCGPGPDPEGRDTGPSVATERLDRLIRADGASSLLVRVHLPAGEVPPGDPLSRVVSLLEAVVDKPGGVQVHVAPADLPRQAWTPASLDAALDTLAVPPPSDTAVIDVVAVRGAWADPAALGLGWAWSRVALFLDPVDAVCDAAAGTGEGSGHQRVCEAAWATVLRHEVGHVLGLVDRGLPMVTDHADPDHPHHDPDPACLMHHAWETSELSGRLAEDDVDLCPASLADLAAFRDR